MNRYQDHNRTRNKTVSFRLTPEEYRQMEERIKITGLPKNEFMIRSMLEQHISIRVGKFESESGGASAERCSKWSKSPRRSGRFAIRMQSTDGAVAPDYQCGKGGVL